MPEMKSATCLSITYLTPVSFASLNGSDKEADNVSSIKKLTRGGREYPYVSAQAVRRALRDQLGVLGHTLSEGKAAEAKKGAAITECQPADYIDDDLFGFMDAAKGGTHKRTSPVRVSPLLGLDPYAGDLDFGTNYMSVESGGNPNIFETEIHGGLYRGSVLIELDAVGVSRRGEGVSAKKPNEAWAIEAADKVARVTAFLTALQHLWSSGRQSRFLADLSPKFVAAAVTTAKSPIFLESVIPMDDGIDTAAIAEVVADSRAILIKHCFGVRSGTFSTVPEGTLTVGDAFSRMNDWVKAFYGA
ncbi:MAG: type I-B CRISPR-associated protein Cas7/Cst2/DevR [Planctomycetaceae bacterium]